MNDQAWWLMVFVNIIVGHAAEVEQSSPLVWPDTTSGSMSRSWCRCILGLEKPLKHLMWPLTFRITHHRSTRVRHVILGEHRIKSRAHIALLLLAFLKLFMSEPSKVLGAQWSILGALRLWPPLLCQNHRSITYRRSLPEVV